ncbi:MAG: chloride channel protein [Candidatus Nanopelagicales bacterium]
MSGDDTTDASDASDASDANGTSAGAPGGAGIGRLLGLAVAIGIVASLLAVLFVTVEHELQALLWTHLPEALGWQTAPAWWVFLLLLIGAVLTWGALQLPGHGGHSPLDDMSFVIDPRFLISVVFAALASLSFGVVLGPEGPLLAIGAAAGAVLMRGQDEQVRHLGMAAGAVSAMGLILGNPLIAMILVLEAAVLKGSPGGKRAMIGILPVLVALGFGYVIQVGVGDWGGFGESVLAVPGLPPYPDLQLVDVAVGIPVAAVVAILAVIAVGAGEVFREKLHAGSLTALVVAALVVATAAVVVSAVTGQTTGTILFSGQNAIPEVLTIGTGSTLIAILIGKTIAYAVSLGSGFRGGKIFPAVFLGVGVGVAASLLSDELNMSALVAAGMAAATAAVTRLPVTATTLAVLLSSAAGLAVTTTAIVGAIVGVLVRVALDARRAPAAADVPPAQPHGAPS